MIKRLLHSWVAIAGIMAMGVVSCSDDEDTGATITKAELMGTWNWIRLEEKWDVTIDGVRHAGTDLDIASGVQEIISIDEYTVVWYSYWGYGECYERDVFPYLLSGNNVQGNEFSGTEMDGGTTYTWTTTVALEGNTLVVTVRETASGPTENGWGEEKYYFNAYSGLIPAVGWPTASCTDTYKTLRDRMRR